MCLGFHRHRAREVVDGHYWPGDWLGLWRRWAVERSMASQHRSSGRPMAARPAGGAAVAGWRSGGGGRVGTRSLPGFADGEEEKEREITWGRASSVAEEIAGGGEEVVKIEAWSTGSRRETSPRCEFSGRDRCSSLSRFDRKAVGNGEEQKPPRPVRAGKKRPERDDEPDTIHAL
jgi:hypothetical protein